MIVGEVVDNSSCRRSWVDISRAIVKSKIQAYPEDRKGDLKGAGELGESV